MQRNDRFELARAMMDLIDHGHRRISRHVDLTRIRVLGMVAAQGPVRSGTIAAELDLTASATSRHLAALEREGRIIAEPDPHDARTFLVRQSDLGHAEIDATVQQGAAVFADVIADWSDADVATALALITRLNQAWVDRGHAAAKAARPERRRARLLGRSVKTKDEEDTT